MRILYAGDGVAGGAADYLLGVLRWLRAEVIHVPPSRTLSPRHLRSRYGAIILSDQPRARVPLITQRAIAQQVREGSGLLMIGGWASFSGPRGGWRGSLIETLLPVTCRRRDDRLSFPGGALLVPQRSHPMLRALSFKAPPMICGLNDVQPKSHSLVLLGARPIVSRVATARAPRVSLGSTTHPLLVIDKHPRTRIAALTTDVAPHWCGGLVDWGSQRLTLPVTGTIRIEVGDRYVRLIANLLRWLTTTPSGSYNSR